MCWGVWMRSSGSIRHLPSMRGSYRVLFFSRNVAELQGVLSSARQSRPIAELKPGRRGMRPRMCTMALSVWASSRSRPTKYLPVSMGEKLCIEKRKQRNGYDKRGQIRHEWSAVENEEEIAATKHTHRRRESERQNVGQRRRENENETSLP